MPGAPEANSTIEVTIRLPGGRSLGPEDVALLEAIRRQRSILSASKALGFSYRKCWLQADALNRAFETTVIATFPGRRGGGAEITPFGERLVAVYRSITRNAERFSESARAELVQALRPSAEALSAPAEATAAALELATARPPPRRSRRS